MTTHIIILIPLCVTTTGCLLVVDARDVNVVPKGGE